MKKGKGYGQIINSLFEERKSQISGDPSDAVCDIWNAACDIYFNANPSSKKTDGELYNTRAFQKISDKIDKLLSK